MNIFVGNLNDMITARHLLQLFVPFGMVYSARILRDKASNHSAGCGYVEMDSRAGKAAISKLNNLQFMNCYLEVTETAS